MTTRRVPLFRVYRAEMVSGIAGAAFATFGALGLAWLYLLPPFAQTGPPEWAQTYHGIEAPPLSVSISVDCPFEVEVKMGIEIFEASTLASLDLHHGEPEDNKFWSRAPECAALALHVQGHFATTEWIIPNLQTMGFGTELLDKRPWELMKAAVVRANRETPDTLRLEFTPELLSQMKALKFAAPIYIELGEPAEARSFSQRLIEANLSATSVYVETDNEGKALPKPTLNLMPFISMDKGVELESFTSPAPEYARGVAGSRKFVPPTYGGVSEVRFTYRNVARQRIEAVLLIQFPVFIGIGAAGMFEAFTKVLATPLNRRLALLDTSSVGAFVLPQGSVEK